jgi:hypothetical protein
MKPVCGADFKLGLDAPVLSALSAIHDAPVIKISM